jgi:N-acetylmuramoyl-L-alanine amidase
VECGFITSESESAQLKRESYRDQVAQGIAKGVALFLQAQPARPGLIATAVK